MNRNIEVKASTKNLASVQALLTDLLGEPKLDLVQTDYFFPVLTGRLKLRVVEDEQSELIFYERSDRALPKTSRYVRTPVQDTASQLELLRFAFGAGPVVRKRRLVYLVGRTRIHLDQVEELGDFIELEVVITGDGDDATAAVEAYQWVSRLGIREDEMIACAYADLLLDKQRQQSFGSPTA